MLPPSKEYAKIIHTREKGINPQASKQDVKNFKEAVRFEKEYINTPKFKERVKKAGYDVDAYRNLQARKLNNLELNVDDSSFNKSGLYYLDNKIFGGPSIRRTVNVPSAIKRKSVDVPQDISSMTHEVGHSYDYSKLEDFINKRNIYVPKTKKQKEERDKAIDAAGGVNDYYWKVREGHEADPAEMSADVHAVRKELYDYTNKKGKTLYDGRYSNFTEDAYKQMKKISRDPNSASYRILDKVGRKKTEAEEKIWSDVDGIDTDAKQEAHDKKTDAIQKSMDRDTKQYIFDIMNRVVDNKKPSSSNYMAMGGVIGSRQRYIAPAVIGAISGAISLISGISGASKAKKAKEEARLATLKQEQDALRASMSQQAQADAQALANFDEAGQEGVQYYKKGGEIAPKTAQNQVAGQMGLANPYSVQGGGLKPNLPVSNGGYQTKGGNLIPIGDGVELAVGNRHNETSVDGVSGIQLSQDGEPVAEIENKEVLADGHTVYSDRLKFKGNKSYADAMVALTKKRNKLEDKQNATNSTAEKNTLDRQLAGLNMAEETLFKIQEVHKEMEGKHVLNNIFAYGGTSPGRPLPVPKWMQTFANTMKTGKYKGYATNALNDYRDPNNPDVIISENGMPKYPYDETIKPFKPKMLATPVDQSAGMSNGSGELMRGITGAATSVIGSIGTDSNKTNVAPTTITTPASVTANNTPSTTSVQNKTGTDWAKIAGMVGSFAPKIIDNIVNSAQTRNAPQLPNLLHSVATPLETRVNINPALSEARQRTATLRKSVLDNTSNSNNAKSNMVATSLATGKQINELLAGKENQEIALRNANAQNRQAVTNANIAQDNERSMMEFQRANDLNTMRSANWANLAGDITSTINEFKLENQFNADTQANIMDDPMGSKAILFAQNKEFMNNKANRDFIFKLAQTKKNPVLVQYLKDNYNYTN